ncbi:MAG: hypothetical protein DRO39_02005 [Thermoprotei archaeon]|nr:MAG: hypothetical protein DRO39_02005 [Thermoprotei archaeon]
MSVVGRVTGTYIDGAYDGHSELVRHRVVKIDVKLNGYTVGTGTLEYDDYVVSGTGGTRTITATGDVKMNGKIVGKVTATITDVYGKLK